MSEQEQSTILIVEKESRPVLTRSNLWIKLQHEGETSRISPIFHYYSG